MNICIASQADSGAGAGRAAYRLLRALRAKGARPKLSVLVKQTGDEDVIGPRTTLGRGWAICRGFVGGFGMRLQQTTTWGLHSGNFLPGGLGARVAASGADIVNVHWVNLEALSIRALGRMRIPAVWTLHDMWAFCGAEHYTSDDRFKEGYSRQNRPPGHRGLDLDKWVWNWKKAAWRHPVNVVTPSTWLGRLARESELMRDWPVTTIANPLDTTVYKPLGRDFARMVLNLPREETIIAFGSAGGVRDLRKGFDLLSSALQHLGNSGWRGTAIVAGDCPSSTRPDLGIPVRYMGRIHDDWSMALMYSAADAVVVPSRQENLPQVATEAQSCGTPVVGFNCTGMPDAVEHGVTGFLAAPYDADELARGIIEVTRPERRTVLSANARDRACALWDAQVIAEKYLRHFERIIAEHRQQSTGM